MKTLWSRENEVSSKQFDAVAMKLRKWSNTAQNVSCGRKNSYFF